MFSLCKLSLELLLESSFAMDIEKISLEIRSLLVEDNLVNQRVAMMMLQKIGLHPDLVGEGYQALRLVKEKALIEKNPYTIIFLDIFLPDIDGLEISRLIRAELPVKDQPFIVALTADESPENRQRYLEGGMDAILIKPLKMPELLEVLKVFQGKRLMKQGVEGTDWRNSHEVLNKSTFLKWQEMLGGKENFRNVVNIYIRDACFLLEGIEKGAVEENWKLVHRNAHTLKSTSANLGALGLASVLEELELVAYENLTGDFSRPVAELIHQARDWLNKVLEELQDYVR